jgi:lactoylglutathione lyase
MVPRLAERAHSGKSDCYVSSMTRIRELRVALTVDDYDRAVSFYRDALGLTEVESWNRPNGRGTILDAGRATLELFDPLQAETLDAIEVGRRVSGTVRLAVHVDDADAAADALVGAGAVREHELVVTPWGDRNARLRAPDGMQLTLFTPPDGGPRAWDGQAD